MSLRILHCLRAPVGGLFRHVRDLAQQQAAGGHDVGVICDSGASDGLTKARLNELAAHLSLGLHQTAMPRVFALHDVRAAQDVRTWTADLKADVIHGHGAKGGAYARLAARSLRMSGQEIAAVYTPHGGSLHYHPSSLKGRLFMAAERFLAGHSDVILFESAYSARIYNAQVGKPRCRTAVIPNGLLESEFKAVTPAPTATDFLFIGELRLLKGVDILLLALARLNETRRATATIVGDGPDAATFKALAKELRLDDCVTFTGAMPVAEAFPLGRALVMPSRAESFPYIVLEAAAAGLPLFATNVGGIPEITGDSGTDLLPPGDADALAVALGRFLDDPGQFAATAAALKDRVARRFTVSVMARDITASYIGDTAGTAMSQARQDAAA